MLRPIDNYFSRQDEPTKSCLLAMRELLIKFDPAITEAWKYGMPFYCYKGRMFCYLWVHKKYRQPYVGIVEGKNIDHPQLIAEKRARMKIFLLDPGKDIPVRTIIGILKIAVKFYK
ncbi:MAG: DUF1801 domain-containing protein [Ferruginibacter sp.]